MLTLAEGARQVSRLLDKAFWTAKLEQLDAVDAVLLPAMQAFGLIYLEPPRAALLLAAWRLRMRGRRARD